MDTDDLLLLACIVGAVAMAGWFVARLLMSSGGDVKLRGRLNKSELGKDEPKPAPKKPATPPLRRVWEYLAHPFMPKSREEQSRLRKLMGQAGIYSPSALRILVGCKVVGLAVGVLAGYIGGVIMDFTLLGISVGGIVGYMLPVFWMRFAIKSNRKAIERGMADALDLMVVCVEAGLTIDVADAAASARRCRWPIRRCRASSASRTWKHASAYRKWTRCATSARAPAFPRCNPSRPCSPRPNASVPVSPPPSASTPTLSAKSANTPPKNRPPRRL